MSWMLISLLLMLGGGLGALLSRRNPHWSTSLGVTGIIAGVLTGLAFSVWILLSGQTVELRLAWPVPLGSFYLVADPLTAFFLLPILLLTGLSAIYGVEYLAAWRGKKSLGAAWFFFNLLAASMVLVVLARNGVLFLAAWEAMSLASFFLVTFENEKDAVRHAGWVYLVATHLGTVCLFLLFVLLGRQAGSLDFDRFVVAGRSGQPLVDLCFILALLGFGTKAGLMPLHVWLPEAHPAAPSHVSAVMSGVMIKTGIYGLMRMLIILGHPSPIPPWWGWLLIGAGLTSGILGVLFALAQHDLKRLLAYHSVENIGIITLGLGLGVLGLSYDKPLLAALGFAGALLHTLNHAIFKGLLFLGAGSVRHAAHTLDLDHLGGLIKRMPVTAACFLVGAISICGLPPFNGFASEFLIYLAAFHGATSQTTGLAGPAAGVIAALALIGGLAAACFTKAFGIVFLGEPRSAHGAEAHDPGPAMRWPMAVLAVCCLLIGLSAPWLMKGLSPAVLMLLPAGSTTDSLLKSASQPLFWDVAVSTVFFLLLGGLIWLRTRLHGHGRRTELVGTWDCGYARPTARMQYTASSFAQPLVDFFNAFLLTRRRIVPPVEPFPRQASLSTDTPDTCTRFVYDPLFRFVARWLTRLHRVQAGSVHLYILYIAITLIVLLVWKLS
jgi:hydrogenase-4 component B